MQLATRGILKGKPLRPAQIDALAFIKENYQNAKIICINAPTGSGKSLIGAEAFGDERIFYLCSSIQLQKQLHETYPEASVLWGRANYKCVDPLYGKKFKNVEQCPMRGNQRCDYCDYKIAFRSAVKNDFSILNFHMFLTLTTSRIIDSSDRHIIIDEADMIEDTLIDMASFSFSLNSFEPFDIKPPEVRFRTKVKYAFEYLNLIKHDVSVWITSHEPVIKSIQKKMSQKTSLTEEEVKLSKLYSKAVRLMKKLEFVLNISEDESDWVYHYDAVSERFKFRLKWIKKPFLEKVLLSNGRTFLLMSATLPSPQGMMSIFDLELSDFEYLELPSAFHPSRRMVICIPAYRAVHSETPRAEIIRNAVKRVLELEKGRKGVIHAVSYKMADTLKGLSPRLMFHAKSDKSSKDEVLKAFLESTDGVLVSPCFTRGLDLPDDKGRFAIWLKCPWPDLSDPLVKIRVYGSGRKGKIWYYSTTAQSIVQGAGRIVRHEEDYGRTYILDSEVIRLLTQHAALFPMWFREAVVFEKDLDSLTLDSY
ncbi:MAG: helicase C-terminal domain-containing protein [Candidatus Methanomethylicaceae archaeon]